MDSEREGEERWLRLSEAARLLRVSPSAVRLWADQERIQTYRTPGGHRRFMLSDLEHLFRRMSDSASSVPHSAISHEPVSSLPTSIAPVNRLVHWARNDLANLADAQVPWNVAFVGKAREHVRTRGRHLLELAALYVTRCNEHTMILDEARLIARAQGRESAMHGLRAIDVANAVHFFRRSFIQTFRRTSPTLNHNAGNLLLVDHLNEFMEAVLIAALEGLESASSTA